MFPSLLTESDNFLDRLSQSARRQGYSLFLVGGSVRDLLMSRPTHDLDLTTDAPVEGIKALLEESAADAVYGIGEKFGTIAARVGEVT
ncbi:MAG TPA: RNA nucleotidyltransferase, partial [Chloroflexia bacterium]|nr:RNA nucleotidyltransferase [Chloroflexia bacterium]